MTEWRSDMENAPRDVRRAIRYLQPNEPNPVALTFEERADIADTIARLLSPHEGEEA